MTFFIATKNQKKLLELKRILEPLGIEAVCESDFNFVLREVEETGRTFEQNAELKAVAAQIQTGFPSIADDSGLCADALNGAPGIYSARYAGDYATDNQNTDKLLHELREVPDHKRTARFVCAICLVLPTGERMFVRGDCEGTIAHAPSGAGGFGYDPVFLVNGKSFASLSESEKDQISHRGKALRKLAERLPAFLEQSLYMQG